MNTMAATIAAANANNREVEKIRSASAISPFTGRPLPVGSLLANAKTTLPASRIAAAALPLKAESKKTADALPFDLGRILRPEAATRWLLPSTKFVTPDYIEIVLRGALTGNHVLQWELFDLMEDTWPRLAKNLNELKRAVLSRDWKINPWAEEDTPPTESAQEKARLVSRAVWTMKPGADEDANDFERTIYDLLDAWAKGISVLEIEWESRSSGNLGEINAPRATYWAHPQNYGFSDEGWLGLNMVAGNSSGVFTSGNSLERFPDDKFLIAICKARSGHPLAGALLRPLAFWWCAANFSASWFLNFAQIFGLPIRWANYDPNTPGLLDKVCAMLENMGSAAWGAFPAGTTLELKEPPKSTSENPQVVLLDRADTQCDILILGQTLTTATPTAGGGTRAQGEVHLSVRADVIQAAADFVAGIINGQLVPMILRLNYPDDSEAPEFCPEEKKMEDALANAERDQILLRQGMEMPKTWFYQRHNIPLPQKGEEVITGRPSDGTIPLKTPEENSPAIQSHHACSLHAKDTSGIVNAALEDLTGVSARWLGGVKPFFVNLMAKAKIDKISDEDFIAALTKASDAMPELFSEIKPDELANALTNAMGAAAANGAAVSFKNGKASAFVKAAARKEEVVA